MLTNRCSCGQIQALGRPSDVAVGISTSGRSANVLQGLAQGRQQGLTTIVLVGADVDLVAAVADIAVPVPARSAARVQEAQLTALHATCELVEDHFTPAGSSI